MTERQHSRWDWAGPAVGLLWLAFPIASMAGQGATPAQIVLAAAGSLTYAWLFIARGARQEREWRPGEDVAVIGAMTAIAIVLTLAIGAEWAMLFVFVTVPGGLRLPPDRAFWLVLALVALAAGLSLTDPEIGSDVAVTWAAATFGTGLLFISLGRVLAANAELKRARAELAEHAVAEERLRFARDLHDLLGHSLSVIALKAELAGRLLRARPAEAAEHVADVERVARSALAEVRDAVSGYRRPTLAGEVAGARVALAAAGIEAEVSAGDEPLDAEAEAVLAWAVREGTTNVIRHSGARRVRIVVDGSSAEIADDGRGGDGSGHGLDGLRERAERLGGRLEAGPRAGGGFGLRVTLP